MASLETDLEYLTQEGRQAIIAVCNITGIVRKIFWAGCPFLVWRTEQKQKRRNDAQKEGFAV
jgi:hypothetical protein